MSKLVNPHCSDELINLLVHGEERQEELKYAKELVQVPMTSRETSDLIMIGIGAFTPLDGFMDEADWKSVCENMQDAYDGNFWPIPITLSISEEMESSIKNHQDVSLVDEDTKEIIGIMSVYDKYVIDKEFECKHVFGTIDENHPGVKKVMEQKPINIAGSLRCLLSESFYPRVFSVYQRPEDSRRIFEERGWNKVAALQLRNPMHNSHAYLAKVAIEVCDGVYIHQLLGELKPGDIPADVRVKAIEALVDNYFRKDRVVQGGYPLEMRYAGPREALLHAVFRQNYGCSHLIVGRDHAGVGDYYGPFDAQNIFNEIPKNALEIQPLCMDWTFYCYKCGEMASMKTCPHDKEDRLLLSGTRLREMLSKGEEVPKEFSKPEVVEILREYYNRENNKFNVLMKEEKYGTS